MIIHDVEFLGSFEREDQCPKTEKPEYAFIGRSNVGKSSLINMLLSRKDLARTSGTPGKTQTLNYYEVNETWRIVDLPGYGYAKISKTARRKWANMINTFLKRRRNLVCVFSLIDARLPLQQNDLDFINSLGEKQIPYVLVYTKTDKLKEHEIEENIKQIQDGLLEHWEVLPQQFITSSNTGLGREDVLNFISDVNNNTDF